MRIRSRRPSRQYAVVPNAAMRDQRLSIAARGLLALLMTYSDDWEFFVEHLQEVSACGRDKMRGLLRELEAHGYVVREVLRGDGGRLLGTQWVILDEPDATSAGVDRDGSPQDDVDSGPDGASDRETGFQGIGTDRLKTRPPDNPTAGESAPIRKPTDKKTKLKNPQPPQAGLGAGDGDLKNLADEDFDRFWSAFPKPRERTEARRAFAEALARGADPQRLASEAAVYAKSAEVQRGYVAKPANWLRRGGWTSDPPVLAAVDHDALARSWVDAVNAGRSWVATGLSTNTARRMVELGLATADRLRSLGVNL